MNLLDPLALDFWLGIGTAILCGGIIGFERRVREKPAGVRTSILICLGTHIFVVLSMALQGPNADPTRVIGQVVTGVGFLGAGVILAREGLVKGVTSAAVIWVLAAIGATIGAGQYVAAVLFAIVAVFILTGIETVETGVRRIGKLETKKKTTKRRTRASDE